MIQYLTFCLFSSIAIVGLHLTSGEGALLHFLRLPFERAEIENEEADRENQQESKFWKFMAWIGKPIIMCPLCMASIWGTVMYCLWFEQFDVREWICCCFAIACLNTFIIHLYDKIK